MNPSAPVVQCPFCLGRRRVRADGTIYAHDRGRPGVQKECPGSGMTKEAADARQRAEKLARTEDQGLDLPSDQSDRVDEVKPEDIF